MSKKAILVLEDGSSYEGYTFGGEAFAYGEVVFNTSMTGYQEMLTDPSYAGQILVLTYPLIGNYGVNDHNLESAHIQVRGFVVREMCDYPSHWQSQRTVDEFLAASGVPGIHGVDTRALTRHLRYRGVMMGAIGVDQSPEDILARLRSQPRYDNVDFVKEVSTKAPYQWERPRTCRIRVNLPSLKGALVVREVQEVLLPRVWGCPPIQFFPKIGGQGAEKGVGGDPG